MFLFHHVVLLAKNILTEYHHVVLLAKNVLGTKIYIFKRETEIAERLVRVSVRLLPDLRP